MPLPIKFPGFTFAMLMMLSCNQDKKEKPYPIGDQTLPNRVMQLCFNENDTTNAGQSIGCNGSNFKLINNQYVIGFHFYAPLQFDSCLVVTIDSSIAQLIELSIYDQKNANLNNICTDVIIVNNPKPSRILHPMRGRFTIAYNKAINQFGEKALQTTILIQHIEFRDTKTDDKITIENELLWKVIDLGIAG